jgi:tight adherence protein B
VIGQAAAALAVIVAVLPWLLGLRGGRRSAAGPARSARARVLFLAARRHWGRVVGRSAHPDFTSAWIAALDRLGRATGTGSSLAQAVAAEGDRPDTPPGMRELARLRASGLSVREAAARLAPARHPDERLALAVIEVVSRAGGPPGEPIDRAAAVLRERRAMMRERDVGAAQARLSAHVLCALPVAVTAWSLVTDERIRHVLVGTPIGLTCLMVGGGLDLLGWRWMRRIVSRA